ncbi:hypothetical protein BJI67_04905 [Acidihalobacter aeolianus]|uniref:Uncharacterized protein n=1 Tax=Acidihalobacter aeolianus TaxID=2792603 RepID=A0A1D8K6C6_9GAMM|nr:hypothetical protein [Acidihalobacter aeolianus]AOV16498.1 hypothetical protein BJI67_04905 [Acidihalobacter aeolianus]
MKSIKISNLGEIRNELNKYKKGKKFDIHQFNQMARLAWLGKIVMQPLDPLDEKCESFLLYCDYPDEFQSHFLDPDQDLVGQMHIVDGEQALALSRIMQRGVEERALLYQDLRQRDFYFDEFYRPKKQGGEQSPDEAADPAGDT